MGYIGDRNTLCFPWSIVWLVVTCSCCSCWWLGLGCAWVKRLQRVVLALMMLAFALYAFAICVIPRLCTPALSGSGYGLSYAFGFLVEFNEYR